MIVDPREAGLPRWARDILVKLRNNLSRVKHQLEVAERRNADRSSGNIKVAANGFGTDDWVALDDWSLVRFQVDGGYIDVRLDQDRLHINGSPDQLMVFPMASNCLQIRIGRRVK